MILLITEKCWTDDFAFTGNFYERTYEYITATDNVIDALKNFVFEFDTDNVFNNNDTEKIRLFEKGERKYRSIPINFDFPKQKVTYK